MIPGDTYATRRFLPHLEKCGATYFVTFSTWSRMILADEMRTIALDVIVRDHRRIYWLHTAVVMPDHVHVVITPYENWRLPEVMQRMKSVSSHLINRALHRHGALWQDESFDHVIRSQESLEQKIQYVCDNPVRKGLLSRAEDYKCLWKETS